MPKRKPPEPTGSHFGHPTYQNFRSGKPDDYRFVDTDEPLWPDAYFARKCPACGLRPTPEGHDPCLGTLPSVRYACCGHGLKPGYIMFVDGTVIRCQFATVERGDRCLQIRED